MIKIETETELHHKVVDNIKRFYPDALLIAQFPENQDTAENRIDSFRKGYLKGNPDLIIGDCHINYRGLCFEFKGPTDKYQISEEQRKMKVKYQKNGHKFVISNDYDEMCETLISYMNNTSIPCEFCQRKFVSSTTLNIHKK